MANEAETLPNRRKHILSVQEQAYTGATVRYRVDVSDYTLTGTGTTDTVTVQLDADTPVDWMVDKAFANVVTAFNESGGNPVITMIVGTDGDDNAYITSTSVTSVGPLFTAAGAVPAVNDANTKSASADVLQAVFTNATSGSPSTWSAGVVDIYLGLRDCNKMG